VRLTDRCHPLRRWVNYETQDPEVRAALSSGVISHAKGAPSKAIEVIASS
jgi:hypothetical protein